MVIEGALAEADAALDDLGLVALRIEQAMRRSRLGDLLAPALALVTVTRRRVRDVQLVLRAVQEIWEGKDWW